MQRMRTESFAGEWFGRGNRKGRSTEAFEQRGFLLRVCPMAAALDVEVSDRNLHHSCRSLSGATMRKQQTCNWSGRWHSLSVTVMVLQLLAPTFTVVLLRPMQAEASTSFPALILLGDSTLDVGTNNHLETLVKSNFKPYGRDMINHTATGRFSNGLLVADFVAQRLGLPYPLAYLDPHAEGEELLHGVNFASTGSGWVDSTASLIFVRSFTQQLLDLKEYINKLTQLVGPSRTADILSNALWVVSTGSNDYVTNYFPVPTTRVQYTVPQWQNLVISLASQGLQEIYHLGARKIVVASMPAIGCLPAAVTVFGEGSDKCVQYINDAAANANSAMRSLVQSLQGSLPGVQFLFYDIYSYLLDAWRNPATYGFKEVRNACCGTGKIEIAVLCNADSPGTCRDASKYLFFDSYHPSQGFYAFIGEQAYELIQAAF